MKDAGLQRVTVSLDGLDDAVFRRMNDVDFPVAEVLAGIEAAKAAGLGPIKVNMVVKRGTNDNEILPMARRFRGTGMVLRFIEYMDVGATNGWRMDEVLPSAEVVRRIGAEFPLAPLEAGAPPARPLATLGLRRQRRKRRDRRHQQRDPEALLYCHDLQPGPPVDRRAGSTCACSRARGTTCGRCCAAMPTTPRSPSAIGHIWQGRGDRYSELRASRGPDTEAAAARRVEMSYIGG